MEHYLPALKMAWARFNTKNDWVMCSHVAMALMLALFPFCIFVLSLAGFLNRDLDVGAITDLVFSGWPAEVSAPIEEEMRPPE